MQQILLLTLAFFFTVTLPAQEVFVTGTVTDEHGETLVGAYVTFTKDRGTVTDLAGHYELLVPANAELTISYLGYADRRITLAGQPENLVDVILSAGLELETVVVTALGSRRKCRGDCWGVVHYFEQQPAPAVTPPLSYLQSATVYPNPFVGELSVEMQPAGSRTVSATLTDVTGRLVQRWVPQTVFAPQHTLHLRPRPGKLLPGTYLLRLTDEEGRTEVRKVIKTDGF